MSLGHRLPHLIDDKSSGGNRQAQKKKCHCNLVIAAYLGMACGCKYATMGDLS